MSNSLMLVVLSWFLIVLAAMFLILLLATLIESIWNKRKKSKHERHIQKLCLIMKASHVSFYYNIQGDVYAVCTPTAFKEAIADYLDKLANNQVLPWDKVICYANPTFTFAGSEQTRRPIHTGTLEDLDEILNQIIQRFTKTDPRLLSRQDRSTVLQSFCTKDSRLFVPFSGNNPFTMEEQAKMFGQQLLSKARECLLR